MAKIRIHEIAKELNVESKDIIGFLGGEFKPMSGIEDDMAEKVRSQFGKKVSSAPVEKKAEEVKPAAVKKEEKPAVKAVGRKDGRIRDTFDVIGAGWA